MAAAVAPNEDMIRARAHALWLEEGCPDGRAEIHWFRAVALVKTEAGEKPATPARPKRKPARKAS